MTIAEFEQTPRYVAFATAAEAGDFEAQVRILREATTQTSGEERELWVRFQEQLSWTRKFFQPEDAVKGWADLREILATAHSDEWQYRDAITRAVGLYGMTERTDLWTHLFPEIQPHLRLTKKSWAYCHNLGLLRLRQRRWGAAYQAFTRAMTRHRAMKSRTRSAVWVHMHAHRAIAAVARGRLPIALEDVAIATAIESEYERSFVEPYGLALAQAEVALAQGRFQVARMALQEGMARATTSQHKPKPVQYVDFDLAAARIARAEGNTASFQHFCEQALARCLAWNLRMSEVSVRAVMAGAER